MKYIDYAYYKSIYADKALPEADFNRLLWDAEMEVDRATTGVDGVRKLEVAFPINERDAEAVKRSICALVDFLYAIEKAEKGMSYTETPNGVHGGIIQSVSAGNESVSYANAETAISNALKSANHKYKAINDFIVFRLGGILDSNGVHLLYMGAYPKRI